MENNSTQGLQGLIERSLRYPSLDGAQPFLFKILSSNTFEVYFDTDRSVHQYGFGNLPIWLAVGGLLENLNLESKRDQFKIDFTLSAFDSSKKIRKLAEVNIAAENNSSTVDDQFLIDHLDKRYVDPRAYSVEPLPEEHISWLTKQITLDRSLIFSYLRKLPAPLFEQFLLIEELTWKDRKTVSDFLSWTGFNTFKPLLKMFRSEQNFNPLITKSNRRLLENQIKNSSGFGFLGLSNHEPQNIVNLGRSFFRIWVYLNAHGYGFQPLTIGTLAPYADSLGLTSVDGPKDLYEAYSKTRRLLQHETMMTESFVPVWGFRTGRANPLPAKAKSPEKRIEDVLIT